MLTKEDDTAVESTQLTTKKGNRLVDFFRKRNSDIKSVMETLEITAVGGAALVNYFKSTYDAYGENLSAEDHKILTFALMSYWAIRSIAAALINFKGIKQNYPETLQALQTIEKYAALIMSTTGFLYIIPIPMEIKIPLQITFAALGLTGMGLTLHTRANNSNFPLDPSYQDIKAEFGQSSGKILALTGAAAAFSAIQTGAATYAASNALTDIYVDSELPSDPINQQFILLMISAAAFVAGGSSILHPATIKVKNYLRSAEVNTGLVSLALISLVFDFAPEFFYQNDIAVSTAILVAAVIAPAFINTLVIAFDQNNTTPAPVNMEANIQEPEVIFHA